MGAVHHSERVEMSLTREEFLAVFRAWDRRVQGDMRKDLRMQLQGLTVGGLLRTEGVDFGSRLTQINATLEGIGHSVRSLAAAPVLQRCLSGPITVTEYHSVSNPRRISLGHQA